LKKFKLNVAKALIVSIRCGWDRVCIKSKPPTDGPGIIALDVISEARVWFKKYLHVFR
jgi:hypothetical protein